MCAFGEEIRQLNGCIQRVHAVHNAYISGGYCELKGRRTVNIRSDEDNVRVQNKKMI